jgi:RNA polymerase sigma-32 factor
MPIQALESLTITDHAVRVEPSLKIKKRRTVAIRTPKTPKGSPSETVTPKKSKGRSKSVSESKSDRRAAQESDGVDADDESKQEVHDTSDEGDRDAGEADASDEGDLGDDFGDSQIIEVAGELVEEDQLLETKGIEHAIVSPERGLAKVDALQLYMSDVQRHALLSADEEKSIAEEYHRTGNVDLAARLVTANLRLVVKLAYEYRRACRNVMDLIQEGNIGLMQAVKRYDPYRGVKLSSYAAWWIRAYMLRYVLNNWRLVKLGTTQAQRKLFFNLNKEKAKLSAMGIEPSHAEIAKRLDVDEKDVVEMDRRLASSDASLDTPIGDADGKQTSRMDLLPATAAGPDQLTESYQLQELLREHLEDFKATLAGKDLLIFEQRLVADEPVTLQELGEQFGVSRERVRQLEARIAGKLRTFLSERLGDAVLIRD